MCLLGREEQGKEVVGLNPIVRVLEQDARLSVLLNHMDLKGNQWESLWVKASAKSLNSK